jgi:hypothetical protein
MENFTTSNRQLYDDSAYFNYELEDYFKELEQIDLLIERKFNSKRGYSPALAFIKKQMRKRIETTFSQINALFRVKFMPLPLKAFC